MTINEARTFLNLLSNKTQSGGFNTTQFNLAAQRAQMEEFNAGIKKWQETQVVTEAIKSFLKNVTLASNDGRLSLPTDYAYYSSLRTRYIQRNSATNSISFDIEVPEIDNGKWGASLSSQVAPPTRRFPKCSFFSNYLEIRPTEIQFVEMDYFRVPKNPIWNFTIVNNREVFNPIGSVSFEMDDLFHNDIVFRMASYLGINLSFPQFVQYAEAQKQNNLL